MFNDQKVQITAKHWRLLYHTLCLCSICGNIEHLCSLKYYALASQANILYVKAEL